MEACTTSLAGIECRRCRWTDLGSSKAAPHMPVLVGGLVKPRELPDYRLQGPEGHEL